MNVSRSVLHGMPRSALSMAWASVVLTHQLIQATAASAFFVFAEADHSMLALYQALRSAALPVRLGSRSSFISVPPAAASMASSWLELDRYRAALPSANALWARGLAELPLPSWLICWTSPRAPAFWYFTIDSSQPCASVSSKPRPLSVNSSLPFCRSQVPKAASEPTMPDSPKGTEVFLATSVAASIMLSQVQVLSSGTLTLAFSNSVGLAMITRLLMPALMPTS